MPSVKAEAQPGGGAITVATGAASITLDPSGKVTITGTEIVVAPASP